MLMHEPHELLGQRIKRHAQDAIDSRQVANRLRDLLPVRFKDIRYRYVQSLNSVAKAERCALIDKDFVSHLEELANVRYDAIQSRIQYETHMMLIQARQSLRALARR